MCISGDLIFTVQRFRDYFQSTKSRLDYSQDIIQILFQSYSIYTTYSLQSELF